jgi:hypothetical protein
MSATRRQCAGVRPAWVVPSGKITSRSRWRASASSIDRSAFMRRTPSLGSGRSELERRPTFLRSLRSCLSALILVTLPAIFLYLRSLSSPQQAYLYTVNVESQRASQTKRSPSRPDGRSMARVAPVTARRVRPAYGGPHSPSPRRCRAIREAGPCRQAAEGSRAKESRDGQVRRAQERRRGFARNGRARKETGALPGQWSQALIAGYCGRTGGRWACDERRDTLWRGGRRQNDRRIAALGVRLPAAIGG